MKPYYEQDGVTIYHGDCRDVLPTLEPAMAALVLADPPYHGAIDEKWDNQWRTDAEFLEWLGLRVDGIDRVLADNGTLYLFCSSRMQGRIEALIAQRMSVIANCVWCKGDERSGVAGTGIDVTSLRTYWTSTNERCVVAEKGHERYRTSDDAAKLASGYWTACEAGKRSVFGDYLVAEFARAGVTRKEIAALFPSRTGGLTGCVSNWVLGLNIPTPEQYEAIRKHLNTRTGGDYLRREYDYLRREYEDLRREYEDLRREYEDLRRPFRLHNGHQWGEIWRFSPHRTDRVHPAQKPEALIGQIIDVSSRPGNVVIDPFMGSGTTLVAAKRLGRKAIGIELEEKYCEIAAKRLAQGALPMEFSA